MLTVLCLVLVAMKLALRSRSGPGATFFSVFGGQQTGNWQTLRNAWELSHAIIFGLVTTSLIAMAYATSVLNAIR